LRIAIATAGLCLALAACSPTKEYDYPAWGFAASFPAPPTVTEVAALIDGTRPHAISLDNFVGGKRTFEVQAAEATGADASPDEFLAAVPQRTAQSVSGEVTSTTYVATGAVTGREVRISKDGKPFEVMRAYAANGHLYVISVISTPSLDDPAVKSFLDSFKLLPAPPATAAPTNSG
jgi:hypothetical protein